jgi:DNA-3-methyladenine glycosylase
MYQEGGCSYVYLCYGIYPLLNVITNKKDVPHGILIRAIEPVQGQEVMLHRRKIPFVQRRLTAGPGACAIALGIGLEHSGLLLTSSTLWIEDHGTEIGLQDIIASPRVGVDYAGEDAKLPWRFRLKTSLWTSPAK